MHEASHDIKIYSDLVVVVHLSFALADNSNSVEIILDIMLGLIQ